MWRNIRKYLLKISCGCGIAEAMTPKERLYSLPLRDLGAGKQDFPAISPHFWASEALSS
jgi:hypothetical protein